MPALIVESPMHSPPHYSHFDHPQAFHGSSPLSSPTSAISYDSSSTGSFTATDDDRPPDLPCFLRFGDIPVSSFVGSRGLVHSPVMLQLHGSSVVPEIGCSLKGEQKILGRSPSKLGGRGSSPVGGDAGEFEISGSEGIPVSIPVLNAAACCVATGGLCSNSGYMVGSPALPEAIMALQKFLPSNVADDDEEEEEEEEMWPADSWPALDVYACDDFRMYEFKVRKCVRGRSHDWTECPFAHPGEKARRRDPRRYHYSGTACPDFRKGNCRRGEACEYAHGVFECWLHPARYRTQPCKDGRNCRRRVCFFAHTPEQLRVVPAEGESPPVTPGSGSGSSSSAGSARSTLLKAAALSGGAYDGSPLRRALAGTLDGTVALELFLDDTSSKSPAARHHHYHHHWIGAATSPSSTLVGLSAAAASSPSPMSSPVLSPASPPPGSVNSWPVVPAHRSHLDRLRSVPTISIPAFEDACVSPTHGSPRTIAEMMSTLHSLQLASNATSVQSCRTTPSSSAWSVLSQQPPPPPSQSAPSTPKSRYPYLSQISQAEPADIKSSSYSYKPAAGASASTSGGNEISPAVETDAPDLAWVNELVQ